jgi:hypothetical protein
MPSYRDVDAGLRIDTPMNGHVESASLDFGPFTRAGLDECILGPFRRVHVGAFKGGRVMLTRELTIK